MDHLGIGSFRSLGKEMGEIRVEERGKGFILFCELVKHSDTVDYTVIMTLLDNFGNSGFALY